MWILFDENKVRNIGKKTVDFLVFSIIVFDYKPSFKLCPSQSTYTVCFPLMFVNAYVTILANASR